ncbi:MAG TPA: hypothetical protein VF602_06550 [Pedobacter sp.]|jgi:hypothetical protein
MSEQDKNQKKEQMALYISPELIEKVEDLLFNLKKQLPREKRKKLTRSQFLELILESIILDYETNQLNSPIQKIVSGWSAAD